MKKKKKDCFQTKALVVLFCFVFLLDHYRTSYCFSDYLDNCKAFMKMISELKSSVNFTYSVNNPKICVCFFFFLNGCKLFIIRNEMK